MNERLRQLTVTTKSSIRATMQAIDNGGVEIALVVDGSGRLAGTVSDGDVRRSLLSGANLSDPVGPHVQRAPAWVGPDADRAGVLDLMRARQISQVPVVDPDGRVIGLHVLQELLGAHPRDNIAVVLAGGRGYRLRPLTDGLPKPMLPVAGRPILERIVLNLVGFGVSRIYLAVGYLAALVSDHFGDGKRFGCEIRYLEEDPSVPLGSGGPLSLVPQEELPQGLPLIVMNGDLVALFDLDHLIATHEQSGCVATIGSREYVHELPFGVLAVDGGRLRSISEKPVLSWSINAGVYILQPDLVGRIPRGQTFPIIDLFVECLSRGEPIAVHPLKGDWLDVGRIDDLKRARGEFS